MFHHHPELVMICHEERRRQLMRRRVAPDAHDRFARSTGVGGDL